MFDESLCICYKYTSSITVIILYIYILKATDTSFNGGGGPFLLSSLSWLPDGWVAVQLFYWFRNTIAKKPRALVYMRSGGYSNSVVYVSGSGGICGNSNSER